MDATQFAESDYITAELVKASKTKLGIITSAPKAEDTDYGMKLTMSVELDGKPKTYRPNKDSVKNIIQELGAETTGWLSKKLKFNVISTLGKDSVIASVQK